MIPTKCGHVATWADRRSSRQLQSMLIVQLFLAKGVSYDITCEGDRVAVVSASYTDEFTGLTRMLRVNI